MIKIYQLKNCNLLKRNIYILCIHLFPVNHFYNTYARYNYGLSESRFLIKIKTYRSKHFMVIFVLFLYVKQSDPINALSNQRNFYNSSKFAL